MVKTTAIFVVVSPPSPPTPPPPPTLPPTPPPTSPPRPPPPPTLPPPPTGGAPFIAQNGVLQVYRNSTRLPMWLLGFGNWTSRHHEEDVTSTTGTGASTVITLSGQVRYSILCTPTADHNTAHENASKLRNGYADTPSDWNNVEVTGYVDITALAGSDSDQDVTWYGPTGRHTADGTTAGCMGTTYKGSLHARLGQNRIAKENYHVNYTYNSWQNGPTGVTGVVSQMNRQGRRVGFKYVNFRIGNTRRIELWVDIGGGITYSQTPVNRWQLIRVLEDTSNFGCCQSYCGVANQQAILWAQPAVTYRWDNQTGRLSQPFRKSFHQLHCIV